MPRRFGRRPPPALLLTAIAATVVILPWALDGSPAQQDRPSAEDTRLTEQPLDGIGGGVTVRELSQPTPFSMVALTGDDLTDTSARIRAKRADGSWGPWYEAEALRSAADDSIDSAPRGTDPVFVGNTTRVQIAVHRPTDAPVTTAATPGDSAPNHDDELGYRPANVEQPLGQNLSAVLISPPQAPVDIQWTPPTAALPAGQPPAIISRAQWGAGPTGRCGPPVYGDTVRAGVVHHTAGNNDYAPEDSAAIIRAIYAYHTQTLGWCDIGYNALVDKYGQVFEGRAGGTDRPVEGSHSGGFNHNTFGVAMLGNFNEFRPPDILLGTMGRLLGWRLGLDHVDPRGTVVLPSAGGRFTHFARGSMPTLPTIFTHRDVGNTDCPGDAAYAALDEIRNLAARFNQPAPPLTLEDRLRGGAIFTKWESMGGAASPLGAPTSPEAFADRNARYATFEHGAMYWSPDSGAEPVTGAIYAAWASLGYERGLLGLPTSAEMHEPLWIVQNFQRGTLNFDRESGLVTRVVDGVAQRLPPPPPDGPPVQLERFTRISN
ncbi:N-acetylmuramoyl-L-alanine amidase [[Mycobacterium] burgundiense]|uniref:N-acetylmuramoyl-L-alanine amidase n=1 Tax=[Mycobacterium] burgundiense TaxID=3064286 RepID=A0ABM9L8G4_9MYCO|nr:N-acetylmuramoyl-L-alanine amidase [Mycolicibacterium sp. MU0053]CAJ1494659.1 N-acetylmuramoyl-L-alanine amidase [Mycolicibacterium sp. MU0053]